MPWLAAVAGGGAQLGAAAIAANQQSQSRDAAMSLINQSVTDLKAIGVPDADALKISLQKYSSAGLLTPEMEQNILQDPSQLNGISTDPRLADAQSNALDSLRQVGQGGFTLADKAALQKSLDAANTQEKGNRDAILQNAAEKGASTGGGTLAAELMGNQGGATLANNAALTTAGTGYDRALQALQAGGQLAGQQQSTQFGQKAQVASAQDAINAMNTQAKQATQGYNVGAANSAQQYNLNNAQNISNANTGVANQQAKDNSQAVQQAYQDSLAKGQALAGARSGAAQTTLVGGQQAAATTAGIGAGVGQTGAALTNYFANQPPQKAATTNPDEEKQNA